MMKFKSILLVLPMVMCVMAACYIPSSLGLAKPLVKSEYNYADKIIGKWKTPEKFTHGIGSYSMFTFYNNGDFRITIHSKCCGKKEYEVVAITNGVWQVKNENLLFEVTSSSEPILSEIFHKTYFKIEYINNKSLLMGDDLELERLHSY